MRSPALPVSGEASPIYAAPPDIAHSESMLSLEPLLEKCPFFASSIFLFWKVTAFAKS